MSARQEVVEVLQLLDNKQINEDLAQDMLADIGKNSLAEFIIDAWNHGQLWIYIQANKSKS